MAFVTDQLLEARGSLRIDVLSYICSAVQGTTGASVLKEDVAGCQGAETKEFHPMRKVLYLGTLPRYLVSRLFLRCK